MLKKVAAGKESSSTPKKMILFLVFVISASNIFVSFADTTEAETAATDLQKEERLSKIRAFLNNFKPYIEIKESANDNIFRTYQDTKSDFITEVSPGLKYGDMHSERKTNIFVDTGVRVRKYAKYNEYGVENPYFDLLFSHNLGHLGLTLDYKFLKDQETFTDLSTTAQEGFVDYLKHYPKLSLDIDWNRFLWELDYSHLYKVYEEGSFKVSHSYKEDTVGFSGNLKVFPKTYFFLEYDRRWRDYTKGGDVDRAHDEYWVGVKGDIFSKMKGLAKFGYEKGHFPQKDKSSTAINVNLNYQASRRLVYNLEIERKIGSSSVSTDSLDRTQSLALTCRYFPPFNKKLQLAAKISLGFDEYESGREDKDYGFSLTSEYSLNSWLKLTGEYKFVEENSDITLAQYKNNITSLKLSFEF